MVSLDDDTSMIEKVHDGEPVSNSTLFGFVEPTTLSPSSTTTTNNKFLRIDNPSSEWIILLAMSNALYEINVYLIDENVEMPTICLSEPNL